MHRKPMIPMTPQEGERPKGYAKGSRTEVKGLRRLIDMLGQG